MKGNASVWEGAAGNVEFQITSQCVIYGSEPRLGPGTRSKALPALGFMELRQVLLRWGQVLSEAENQVSLEASNPQKEGHTQDPLRWIE